MRRVQKIFRQSFFNPEQVSQKLLYIRPPDRLPVIDILHALPGSDVIIQIFLIINTAAAAGQKSSDLVRRKHLVLVVFPQLMRTLYHHVVVGRITVKSPHNIVFHNQSLSEAPDDVKLRFFEGFTRDALLVRRRNSRQCSKLSQSGRFRGLSRQGF